MIPKHKIKRNHEKVQNRHHPVCRVRGHRRIVVAGDGQPVLSAQLHLHRHLHRGGRPIGGGGKEIRPGVRPVWRGRLHARLPRVDLQGEHAD